jgi:hypothetical protein
MKDDNTNGEAQMTIKPIHVAKVGKGQLRFFLARADRALVAITPIASSAVCRSRGVPSFGFCWLASAHLISRELT